MALKCPNCGGSVIYDAASRKMKCEFCDSTFDPEIFNVVNTGAENTTVTSEEIGGEEGLNVYTCKNCGAAMMSSSKDLTIYCDYCGGEVVLTNKADSSMRPQKIIPFTVSKSDCTKEYTSRLKKLLFVPPEFKETAFLQKFNGIYVPYYISDTTYNCEAHGSFTADSITSSTSAYTMHNEVKGNVDCHMQGKVIAIHDAAADLDDTLADQVSPGMEAQAVEYKDSYLSGYYADLPDVNADVYNNSIDDTIQKSAKNLLIRQLADTYSGTISLVPAKGADVITDIKKNSKGKEIVLAPIWFLTWKNKDQAAYAVMSGSTTRKAICDVPIDNKAVYKLSAILSAILIAVLLIVTAFIPIKPEALLSITAIILTVMFAFYRSEIREIACKENHVFDKGYNGTTKMKDKEKEKLRKKSSFADALNKIPAPVASTIRTILLIFVFIPLCAALFTYSLWIALVPFVCLCIAVVDLVKTNHFALLIEKKPGLWLRFVPVPLLAVFFLTAVFSVYDLYYYFASIGGLIITALFGINMINTYNYVVTRPLPGYHDGRKGGMS